MSDKMRPMPFKDLLLQSIMEYREQGSLFYVPVVITEKANAKAVINGKAVETPIGPAAGPHTQLAQNILAAYAAGARYFELKTVQVLDGEALGIKKPCIYVEDEAYNTEWSSELTAYEAMGEYIKAWYLLKLLIKEFELGDTEGFVFNMSVGYNLEGIQSEKIDYFLEHMKEAKDTPIFKECIKETCQNISLFQKVTKEYAESIDSCVCDTVTLSTMHGCPVEEIEGITTYLLKEKALNTYLKCNPTLLGYEAIRSILDTMGYDDITFGREGFEQDMSLETAVELIIRLKQFGAAQNREFGIKLTNTFPVKINKNQLEGEDMYMSGAALYPITIGVAAVLSKALAQKNDSDGKNKSDSQKLTSADELPDIRFSYSGGADENNISHIYEAGIYPITVSTILLKRGGYHNLIKLNKALNGHKPENFGVINIDRLITLAEKAKSDRNYYKSSKNNKPQIKGEYSACCSKCRHCVDVCPNRANFVLEEGNKKYTLHRDGLCNECGNCMYFCIMGHKPYQEKFTVFETEEDFINSENSGIFIAGAIKLVRWEGNLYREAFHSIKDLPEEVSKVIEYYIQTERKKEIIA
jgi:putative selenate reductase